MPSKYFNTVSMLLLRWLTSRRRTLSNQRWNNVVYVNVKIYNFEQRPINVVCFNIDINNVRQRRNNDVILNVEFHLINDKTTFWIWPFSKSWKVQKNFLSFKKKTTHLWPFLYAKLHGKSISGHLFCWIRHRLYRIVTVYPFDHYY